MPNLPDIYQYYDYRKYIRDCYEAMRRENSRYSYRYIQEKAGIDPGYLVKVFNGQRNLTEKAAAGFPKLFKLNKRKTKYFNLLILFGRAKSDPEIKHYFEQLLSFAEPSSKRIDSDCYEFYQKWYYPAVREVLGYYHFTGDYAELAKLLIPQIKESEARKAIELLKRLGFVMINDKGRYAVTSRFLSTGEEWRSIAVRTFQKEAIKLAIDGLDAIPKEQRDISTVTVTLSTESFQKVRDKLRDCREEIMKIAHREEDANGAYHINFQLLPIGKPRPEKVK